MSAKQTDSIDDNGRDSQRSNSSLVRRALRDLLTTRNIYPYEVESNLILKPALFPEIRLLIGNLYPNSVFGKPTASTRLFLSIG